MFGLDAIGKIFGAGDVVKKGLDLIDEAWESAEEKTDNDVKLIEAKTKQKADLLTAYAPFKLAQRYLAFSFAAIFLFIMLNGVFALMYGWGTIEHVKAALDFADSMYLGEIMLTIIVFYFGGGFIESKNRKQEMPK